MNYWYRHLCIIGSLFVGALDGSVPSGNHDLFSSSFINHYDFRAEGRFTHEYHPFLLKKTADSLQQLCSRLTAENLSLKGHIIISGYEANAIPSYYTNFKEAKINDEMSSKSKEGWSLRLHNRFGFMTGYIFKDINEFAQRLPAVKNGTSFIHINPENVELFRDESGVFVRHAFGNAFDFLHEVKKRTLEKFIKKDYKGMLETLVEFWQKLYTFEVSISGNQSAATQDVLFSIEYANYLKNSSLPLYAYYVGADITYPIEISLKQEKEATRNAQDFVKVLTATLKPIECKKTGYVFCSFVDGVGKSTMLGNIKNWMKHGNSIESYERVDNSSSQYADLFRFTDDVFIVDLPAQVSHFTYKPDGLVYVDAKTELDKTALDAVKRYFQEHKESILARYKNMRKSIFLKIQKAGYFSPEVYDPKKPHETFVRNLVLLKKVLFDAHGECLQDKNTWVPFTYKEREFVGDYYDETNIRMLHSLSGAASHGLKNIESEQMLFFDGIRFPLAYDVFLEDLVKKCKSNGIENIVFVNFTSMYPRSCRENIRINYLMQQMALLDESFDSDESLYKKFVNASELYAFMLEKSSYERVKNAFSLEALIRYQLYNLLEEQQRVSLDGCAIENLTTYLKEHLEKMRKNEAFSASISSLIDNKMKTEMKDLKNRFGLTKEFINIAQFSFDYLIIFSDILHDFFAHRFGDGRIASLWSDLALPIIGDHSMHEGFVNKDLKLSDGTPVLARYEFSYECRDARYLSWFMRSLRASWYAAIANILYGKEVFNVPPMLLKPCFNGQIYCITKKLPPFCGEQKNYPYKLFHINRKSTFGEYEGKPYCIEWDAEDTASNVFAFGCDVVKKKYRRLSSKINTIVSEYKDEHGAQTVLSTSFLLEKLKESSEWNEEFLQTLARAQANGNFNAAQCEQNFIDNKFASDQIKTYLGGAEHREAAKLVVRLLASLEMILKDPDSDIVVRRASKKDFRAALELFEKTTLPKYFGIVFKEPLFDDYKKVDPIIPWEFFKR